MTSMFPVCNLCVNRAPNVRILSAQEELKVESNGLLKQRWTDRLLEASFNSADSLHQTTTHLTPVTIRETQSDTAHEFAETGWINKFCCRKRRRGSLLCVVNV